MDGLYLNTVVLTFLGIAAYYDAKDTRIPNILTYAMLVVGFLQSGFLYYATRWNAGVPYYMPIYWTVDKEYIIQFILMTAILFINVFIPLMGGGDTKLLMGLCLLIRPSAMIQIFIMSHLAVGLILIWKYIFAVKIQVKRLLSGEFKKGGYVSAGRIPMAPAFFIMYAAYVMCPVTKLITLF